MADKKDILMTPDEATRPEKTIKPVNPATPVKTKTKRLSKSKRTHIRRMKAEARREGVVYRPGIE